MKTIFQDLEYLRENVKDKEAKRIVKELEENFHLLKTKSGLSQLMGKKKLAKITRNVAYEEELKALQVELIKLQNWVYENNKRVMIIFEGRDAAGKGGAIRRFTEHLNPRSMKVVALPKPTDEEKGQWYFQRYAKSLPNAGEICFFDRSWYNRAVVEPAMSFCTKKQYEVFLQQVPEFEHMLYEDNIEIVKFWFSISKKEQSNRFASRKINPLKQWKLSPVDAEAQERWAMYTKYKEEMFSRTHTSYSPWVIVRANNKKRARLESIRHVLSVSDYQGKGDTGVSVHPDPNIVLRFHRASKKID